MIADLILSVLFLGGVILSERRSNEAAQERAIDRQDAANDRQAATNDRQAAANDRRLMRAALQRMSETIDRLGRQHQH